MRYIKTTECWLGWILANSNQKVEDTGGETNVRQKESSALGICV